VAVDSSVKSLGVVQEVRHVPKEGSKYLLAEEESQVRQFVDRLPEQVRHVEWQQYPFTRLRDGLHVMHLLLPAALQVRHSGSQLSHVLVPLLYLLLAQVAH
jgi:hypothetical protein